MIAGEVKSPKKLDPGFLTKTSMIQLFYGIWVNMAQLGIGLAFGLPAVQIPQLTSPDSEVLITREEASWIASILTLFSPIGCLLSGFIIDRFGRRVMVILCQGPMCIGWLYTGLSRTAIHIILGRALTGIGCGMAMGPPRIYSTEISLPNMRGVIGTFPSLAMALGICLQAGFGAFFKWQSLCYICCGFTAFNFISFNLLPETPYFVLLKGNPDKARKTLAKFRGPEYDLDAEIKQLLEYKADNNIRKLSVKENTKLIFSRGACKPFLVINAFVVTTHFSGVTAILMWSIEILTEANSSFDVHSGNFLLAITRLIVGTITSILLFRIGRRPLAVTSAVGVTLVCISLGIFIHYNAQPSLTPQMCLMAYMTFASLGYYTLPYLMMAELYPLQVRGTLGGITVSISSIWVFLTTKVYPHIRDNIGLANTIILYGICSCFGAVFLYFCLPETKDLTLQEIEEYYNARRPTLTSQRLLMTMQQFSRNASEDKSEKKPTNTKDKFKRKKINNKKDRDANESEEFDLKRTDDSTISIRTIEMHNESKSKEMLKRQEPAKSRTKPFSRISLQDDSISSINLRPSTSKKDTKKKNDEKKNDETKDKEKKVDYNQKEIKIKDDKNTEGDKNDNKKDDGQ